MNTSKMQEMGKTWLDWRDVELEMWRKNSKELISDFQSKGDLRAIVYDGLSPSGKTFYLLNPFASAPPITRTLNFSRRGFQ